MIEFKIDKLNGEIEDIVEKCDKFFSKGYSISINTEEVNNSYLLKTTKDILDSILIAANKYPWLDNRKDSIDFMELSLVVYNNDDVIDSIELEVYRDGDVFMEIK